MNKVDLTVRFPLTRCIAKTGNQQRCFRPPVDHQHFLCHHHQPYFDDWLSSRLGGQSNSEQMGGATLPILYAPQLLFNMMVPSCIDVIDCDWTTGAVEAVPGLSMVFKLFND